MHKQAAERIAFDFDCTFSGNMCSNQPDQSAINKFVNMFGE